MEKKKASPLMSGNSWFNNFNFLVLTIKIVRPKKIKKKSMKKVSAFDVPSSQEHSFVEIQRRKKLLG